MRGIAAWHIGDDAAARAAFTALAVRILRRDAEGCLLTLAQTLEGALQRGQNLSGAVEVLDRRLPRAALHHLPRPDADHVVEQDHTADLHAHEGKLATAEPARS